VAFSSILSELSSSPRLRERTNRRSAGSSDSGQGLEPRKRVWKPMATSWLASSERGTLVRESVRDNFNGQPSI
jgi:hypothetical protein